MSEYKPGDRVLHHGQFAAVVVEAHPTRENWYWIKRDGEDGQTLAFVADLQPELCPAEPPSNPDKGRLAS